MRIVLRRISTGLYYQPDGSWTADPIGALDFGSLEEAQFFAQENALVDFEVVKKITLLQDLAQRVRVYFAHYG